jgi:5S rRNA maturation endonuclease (ribonuclease M5)
MGEINLNSFVYNKSITKEDIFSCVSQEELYSFYIGQPIISGTKLCSPLREDNVPSFSIFYHKQKDNVLMFKDHATGHSGDIVLLVSYLFGLKYTEALWKIAYDLKLTDVVITAERKAIAHAKKITSKETVKIGIKVREWQRHDANFWKSFGIKKTTLKKYNVVPIKYVFFNGDAFKVDKHAYAYVEFKDDNISYKIYQPFNAQFKWINNANHTVHQGYTQLPKKGELLIITKSLKDVMSLRDVMSIPSVGLQSESVMMKQSVMDEYQNRFEKVVCLFDNDAAGKKLSKEFSEQYNIPHFFVPEIQGVTDFSDLVKIEGIDKSKQIFKHNFNEIRW